MNKQIYDVAIIGGGPAGYSAALYCARSALSVLVLEKLSAGGQMATTGIVENYPGFEEGIDGFDLGEKMQQQAERFGAKTVYAGVEGADLTAQPKAIWKRRRLSLPQEPIQESLVCQMNPVCEGAVSLIVQPVTA